MTGLLCSFGCLGCSFCDEHPLPQKEIERKKENDRRWKKLPSLTYSFKDILKKSRKSVSLP